MTPAISSPDLVFARRVLSKARHVLKADTEIAGDLRVLLHRLRTDPKAVGQRVSLNSDIGAYFDWAGKSPAKWARRESRGRTSADIVASARVARLLRALEEDIGAGQFKLGRRGMQSRFEWSPGTADQFATEVLADRDPEPTDNLPLRYRFGRFVILAPADVTPEEKARILECGQSLLP